MMSLNLLQWAIRFQPNIKIPEVIPERVNVKQNLDLDSGLNFAQTPISSGTSTINPLCTCL